jgi:hypothetical protein
MSEAEEKKEEKPVKLESVAEETGELIGKGVKKTWDVVKSFGKGIADTIDGEEKGKDQVNQHCPQCEHPVSPKSNFCANCGKKL